MGLQQQSHDQSISRSKARLAAIQLDRNSGGDNGVGEHLERRLSGSVSVPDSNSVMDHGVQNHLWRRPNRPIAN